MNVEELPKCHYFWVLPEEDVSVKLEEVLDRLRDVTLLVTWETYMQLRLHYPEQLKDRDYPEWNCLDMFVLKTPKGKCKIMLTR